MPDGDRLCHGDFHPINVLGDLAQPLVIDWLDAARGAPAADACRSYLLLRLHAADLAEPYLDAYGRAGGVPRAPPGGRSSLSERASTCKPGAGSGVDRRSSRSSTAMTKELLDLVQPGDGSRGDVDVPMRRPGGPGADRLRFEGGVVVHHQLTQQRRCQHWTRADRGDGR